MLKYCGVGSKVVKPKTRSSKVSGPVALEGELIVMRSVEV